MVHFVRKTDQGVEMRSRFWMGCNQKSFIKKIVSSEKQMCDMYYHCEQEYNQLAGIIYEIYNTYKNEF